MVVWLSFSWLSQFPWHYSMLFIHANPALTYLHRPRHPSCLIWCSLGMLKECHWGWRNEFNWPPLLSEQLSSAIINTCTGACSVIPENNKPFNSSHMLLQILFFPELRLNKRQDNKLWVLAEGFSRSRLQYVGTAAPLRRIASNSGISSCGVAYVSSKHPRWSAFFVLKLISPHLDSDGGKFDSHGEELLLVSIASFIGHIQSGEKGACLVQWWNLQLVRRLYHRCRATEQRQFVAFQSAKQWLCSF